MSDKIIAQKEIATWFDNTYKTLGEWYLRPVDAYKIFLTFLDVRPGHRILDVACGLGRMIDVSIERNLDAYGVDISSVAIEKTQMKYPKSNVQVSNAESLPFNEKTFHYITCLGSLERMLDRKKALSEMYRVLTPDGKLCLLVRNSENWFWKFIQKPLGFVNVTAHQDAMNMEEWSELFEENGFKLVNIYEDQWPLMKWKRYFSLGMWNGYDSIHKGIIPLKYAYEFVFILQKKA